MFSSVYIGADYLRTIIIYTNYKMLIGYNINIDYENHYNFQITLMFSFEIVVLKCTNK